MHALGRIGTTFTATHRCRHCPSAGFLKGNELLTGAANPLFPTSPSWSDFLAGRTEESSPEEILLVIERLVKVLPEDYQSRLIGKPNGEGELETVKRC
jgi:hypothetical protein